jgi:hypothetical protein
MKTPEPCAGGCTHTDLEHTAFDRGVAEGRAGKEEEANPYRVRALREAWSHGRSVGLLDALHNMKD